MTFGIFITTMLCTWLIGCELSAIRKAIERIKR